MLSAHGDLGTGLKYFPCGDILRILQRTKSLARSGKKIENVVKIKNKKTKKNNLEEKNEILPGEVQADMFTEDKHKSC